MQKQIIGTLVAALIIFIWQFVSWAAAGIHQDEMGYTDKQDEVLQALTDAGLEEGTYFMPQAAPGSSPEEMEAMMKSAEGKPWARVSYRSSYSNNMGINMARGFAVDILSAFLLIWLLLKFETLNFSSALMGSISVGLIGYFTIPYLNSVWFEGSTIGYLIDAFVQWGLVGAWLGWWLPRGK